MGLEIERKFLVNGEAWREAASRSQRMVQGYLSRGPDKASVRVRLQGDEARLNIKAAVVGTTRAEFDYPMPLADARELLETLCVATVDKTRHWVEYAGSVWEVDEFLGDNEGLVIAEIELNEAKQRFERPSWLGAEVTDDRRYYNHQLALHPFRLWRG